MKVGLTAGQYKQFQDLLVKTSGIVLKANQTYLIENRLASLLRDLGLTNFDDLLNMIPGQAKIAEQIVDLMTTNETLWFRDKSCWETVEKICIPKLVEKLEGGQQRVNIWSAASSTGQEAYSLSILIHEYLGARFKNSLLSRFNIIGTDISPTVIAKARLGEYDSFSLSRGMSKPKADNYFTGVGDIFTIKDEIKKMVVFKDFNLMNNFSLLGRFDLILCRNVLIYFSDETKTDILNRMANNLTPEGIVVLGATESTYGMPVNLVNNTEGTGLYLTSKVL
ncbi:MAG: protein-glutamate O-methyltransferase CheR [SAR324 cluster bacterium]|nr:protein-glutamate O-methyltransferase CheR [SAR324 cluster bacterium]